MTSIACKEKFSKDAKLMLFLSFSWPKPKAVPNKGGTPLKIQGKSDNFQGKPFKEP